MIFASQFTVSMTTSSCYLESYIGSADDQLSWTPGVKEEDNELEKVIYEFSIIAKCKAYTGLQKVIAARIAQFM
jgi:hypothetical protein